MAAATKKTKGAPKAKTARRAPRPERVSRDVAFNMRFSAEEKQQLNDAMRRAGYNNLSDFIRSTMLSEHTRLRPPPEAGLRDLLKPGGNLFTDKTMCDLAVAILHLYQIEQLRYANAKDEGSREFFAKGRRRVIESLGLEQMYGG